MTQDARQELVKIIYKRNLYWITVSEHTFQRIVDVHTLFKTIWFIRQHEQYMLSNLTSRTN